MTQYQRSLLVDGGLLPVANHPDDIVECLDVLGLDRFRPRCESFRVSLPSFSVPLSSVPDLIATGDYDDLQLELADSLRAGNCKAGTEEFLDSIGKPERMSIGGLRYLLDGGFRLATTYRSNILGTIYQCLKRNSVGRRNLEIEYYASEQVANNRIEQLREEITEHNSDRFREYFRNVEAFSDDYHVSDDYANDYIYLMNEGDQVNQSVAGFLDDWQIRESIGLPKSRLPDSFADSVAEIILTNGLFSHEISDEYDSTSTYYLDSFPIGECEEQIELADMRERLADTLCLELPNGEEITFDESLAEYLNTQRDFSIDSQWWQKGHSDTIMLTNYIAKRIDWVTSEEQLEQATTQAVLNYCRSHDYNRKEK